MPSDCTFHGTNQFITFDTSILYDLEELFGIVLTFEEHDDLDENHIYQCSIRSETESVKFYGNDRKGRMIVCVICNDIDLRDNLWDKISQWLKDGKGVIIWPITFDNNKEMFDLLDTLMPSDKSTMFYNIRIMFESDDKDMLLDRYSIDISRQSCLQLYNRNKDMRGDKDGAGTLFNDMIIPYIEGKTGFYMMKLPIRHILIQTYLTLTHNMITLINIDDIDYVMFLCLPYLYETKII